MKKTSLFKLLSLIVCAVLIAVTALFTIGCSDTKNNADDVSSATVSTQNEAEQVGEGKTSFNFEVVDADKNVSTFIVYTDKTTVGDALEKAGLIAGDESEFGLYVKTVNGITCDYDKDGKYWAFYIGDEYASTGVDSTEIESGKTYSFKAE